MSTLFRPRNAKREIPGCTNHKTPLGVCLRHPQEKAEKITSRTLVMKVRGDGLYVDCLHQSFLRVSPRERVSKASTCQRRSLPGIKASHNDFGIRKDQGESPYSSHTHPSSHMRDSPWCPARILLLAPHSR